LVPNERIELSSTVCKTVVFDQITSRVQKLWWAVKDLDLLSTVYRKFFDRPIPRLLFRFRGDVHSSEHPTRPSSRRTSLRSYLGLQPKGVSLLEWVSAFAEIRVPYPYAYASRNFHGSLFDAGRKFLGPSPASCLGVPANVLDNQKSRRSVFVTLHKTIRIFTPARPSKMARYSAGADFSRNLEYSVGIEPTMTVSRQLACHLPNRAQNL
jgi:hypothetical protein